MPDADRPRLIEVAVPLKQVSLDSVHEKSARIAVADVAI
jgi:hypothetical protein